MKEIKTYEKLPLPKTSAWDRKSFDPVKLLYGSKTEWSDFSEKAFDLWFVPKRVVFDFFNFIARLWFWVPVLWRDRDWDGFYILEILKRKLISQRKHIVKENRHLSVWEHNRDITICLNLIERIQREYYESEYFDYYDSEMSFEKHKNTENSDNEDGEEQYEMKFKTTRDDLLRYINKYPSDRDRTIKMALEKYQEDLSGYLESEETRRSLSFHMARHRHEKAKRILFSILKDKLECWWN